MRLVRCLAPLALVASAGCTLSSGDRTSSTDNAIREDTSRDPIVVRVAVRFTQNDASDVGYTFSSSWVPFTGVSREKADGFSWGLGWPGTAEQMIPWYQPDQPGAGYATAIFRLQIPYDTTGAIAYGLTRVKLESEFINTQIASTVTSRYSPMRVRSGSDQ